MAHAIVNPDREQLIQCPYDPVHMISQMRFPYHLIKCRKNHDGAEYMQCPYDAKHVIQKNQFQEHVQHCDKKAIIEPQLVLADPCEALVIPESNAAEIQDVLSNDWDIEAPSAAFHHRSKKPVTQTAHNTFNSIGNANGFKRDVQRDIQRGDNMQNNAQNAQNACSSKSNGHIPPRKPELRAPYTSSAGSKQYSETYDHQKSFGRGRAMLRGNSDMSLMTASIGPSSYRKATEGPEMIDAYNPPPMASFGRGRGVMSLNPPQKLRKPGSMGNRKKENMKPDNRPSNLGNNHNGTSYRHHNMTRESLEHHKNKLLKKHREISSLMERQDQGYALERNQIEKIESMKGLEEELHEVCSKLDRM